MLNYCVCCVVVHYCVVVICVIDWYLHTTNTLWCFICYCCNDVCTAVRLCCYCGLWCLYCCYYYYLCVVLFVCWMLLCGDHTMLMFFFCIFMWHCYMMRVTICCFCCVWCVCVCIVIVSLWCTLNMLLVLCALWCVVVMFGLICGWLNLFVCDVCDVFVFVWCDGGCVLWCVYIVYVVVGLLLACIC